MKPEAIKSALYTQLTIGKLILDYQDNIETKAMIGRSIGFFVYGNWPHIKLFLPDVHAICSELKIKMLLPERKKLKLLTLLFGWKRALDIMKK